MLAVVGVFAAPGFTTEKPLTPCPVTWPRFLSLTNKYSGVFL